MYFQDRKLVYHLYFQLILGEQHILTTRTILQMPVALPFVAHSASEKEFLSPYMKIYV